MVQNCILHQGTLKKSHTGVWWLSSIEFSNAAPINCHSARKCCISAWNLLVTFCLNFCLLCFFNVQLFFFVLYYSYLFALLFDPISLPIVKRKWCLIISFPSTRLLSDDDDESVEVDLEGLFSDICTSCTLDTTTAWCILVALCVWVCDSVCVL